MMASANSEPFDGSITSGIDIYNKNNWSQDCPQWDTRSERFSNKIALLNCRNNVHVPQFDCRNFDSTSGVVVRVD